MNPAEMRLDGEVLVRLGIQAVIIVLSGLAARGAWRSYRHCRSPFPQYVSYSLVLLLAKTVFMAFATIWSLISGQGHHLFIVPMIDHLGKLGWTLLLVNAFIICIPSSKLMNRYFLIGNVILMVLVSSIIWLYWLEFLYTAPPGRGTFHHFWGNLFYEAWIALVLAVGLILAWKAAIAPKSFFLLAIAVLIAGEVIHIYDLLADPNRIPWLRSVDRLLIVSYCAIMARLFSPAMTVMVVGPGIDPEGASPATSARAEG